MTRAFWLGFASAMAAFCVLAYFGAVVTGSVADTLDATNDAWLVACTVAGLLAGFLGDRLARAEPVAAWRYAAAIAGPALIALLFALTTTAQDAEGPWIALVLALLGAALGALGRERIAATAQRRR